MDIDQDTGPPGPAPESLVARDGRSCAIDQTSLQKRRWFAGGSVSPMVRGDLTLSASELIGIYQKRWKTEEYHKSIKQCSSLGDSPSHTPETQQAHCIAAIISYVKLEKLKLKNRMNHFALKSQIWVEATRHAMDSMSKLSTTPDKYAYLTA